MRLRVGCELEHHVDSPTPSIWQVRPRLGDTHRVVSESFTAAPDIPRTSYVDSYGNLRDRMTLPPGVSILRYDAVVEVPEGPDESDKDAVQVPVEDLPDEALLYLSPSRLCWSDALSDQAWELFGHISGGWSRAQAVSDWVHENVSFEAGSSTPATTAFDVWQGRRGVCRDFAQLGVTFCRSLNIPARYVAGYLPDIAVPPSDEPMDFCSWLEVYLDGRWWTFDPRNNARRVGRVVISRSRDAVDSAIVTTFGDAVLHRIAVWAEEIPAAPNG